MTDIVSDTVSSTRGRVRTEPSPKRVRAVIGGRVVADSLGARYVWEVPYYPAYYLPLRDVAAELVPTGRTEHSPSRGEGHVHDVRVGDVVREGAALTFPDSPLQELRELVRFDWESIDEWFEEDEPIYVHPRGPAHRVDVYGSSRHVRISLDGVVLAESAQPRILFETGLPPRYYLPRTDTRMELLRPSELRTGCPYKGTASYWDVVLPDGTVHEGLVWGYPTPLPESQKVAGLVCFYNEKVDIEIAGVRQERPRTPFG